MNNVEEVGLVKFDILSIRALTTIQRCTSLVEKTTKQKINIDNISIEDELTYQALQKGDTTGIFQYCLFRN